MKDCRIEISAVDAVKLGAEAGEEGRMKVKEIEDVAEGAGGGVMNRYQIKL